MVNTRRSESSGLVADNGPRYQTRRTNDNIRQLGSSCESDSGGQAEEDESVDEEEDSANAKQPLVTARVRNRFDKRNFGQLHLRTRELRSTRKHISVNDRRHALTVYSSRKMHDDLDSEEDCYSPRHHSRRTHYSKSHIARIERRTALSLRPITRKYYKDHSPGTCNSDESEFNKRRRSMRTRNSTGDKGISWLTDDQMHKVGYPNLRRRQQYFEDDDSRDTQPHHNNPNNLDPIKKRIQPHKNNSNYMFSYEAEDMHMRKDVHDEETMDVRVTQERKGEKKILLGNSRAESQDKENKEDNANHRSAVRSRRQKDHNDSFCDNKIKKESVDEMEQENNDNGNDENNSEIVENGTAEDDVDDEEAEAAGEEDKEEEHTEDSDEKQEESTSQSDESVRPVTRNTRSGGRVKENYSLATSRRRKISGSSSSSAVGPKPYLLRDRAPKQPTMSSRNMPMRNRNIEIVSIRPHRRFHHRKLSSGSSDSSGSDIECRKNNKYSKNSKSPHSKNEQLRSGQCNMKVMPIDPETLDPKISFESVGGLDSHVQCLKEMILLPMMYPEVFQRFQIQPPRGVLFHGPPGTGKTLIARALANECSFGSKKVAFFMRKGADLLNKWVGESEKQLRILFEQAAEMKPSIIFFDELDGLAPVRSFNRDQSHASIVSTLLALMDGLDNRGDVIVIGATNRIDAIDPALRRPGRFDRELFFPLPAQKERKEILKVHVSKWTAPPNEQLVSYLAENAIGYCGSDLRALCSEAVIQSFRRTYPQVYHSDHRLLLNPESVKVEKLDFLRAKSMLVPASQRISQNIGRKLPPVLEPLLHDPMEAILSVLEKSFPHGVNSDLAKVRLSAAVKPAQLLLIGDGNAYGHTTYLAPALLHRMEHIHAHTLDLAALHCGITPEEACIQVFHEAKRNVPSVIYIPNIDLLWKLVSETLTAIFLSQVIQIQPNNPILILATSDTAYNDLPEQILDLFSKYRDEVFEMNLPNPESRMSFFRPLLVNACMKAPRCTKRDQHTPPPLPRAPTPVEAPISKEAAKKLFDQEERTLRELRIFLRDMCKKLASNRLFFMFTKPVDTEEVPDYPTIIKEPMDLETMMTKVDFHRYECAKDFLSDIELICQNALEYNPARTSADKQIRHRACALRDYAFALIKNEMESDFEDKCQEISTTRKKRKASIKEYLPPYLDTPAGVKLDKTTDQTIAIKPANTSKTPSIHNTPKSVSPSRKRKIPMWQQGYISRKKKRRAIFTEDQIEEKLSSGEESKENHPEAVVILNDLNNEEELIERSPDSRLKATALLTVNCDTTTSSNNKSDGSILQSPQSKRRLSDLLSPSELLDDPLDFDDIDQALNEVSESALDKTVVDISEDDLENVLNKTVTVTTGETLQSLLDLHHQLSRIVRKYIRTGSRKPLPKEIHNELMRFVKEKNISKT